MLIRSLLCVESGGRACNSSVGESGGRRGCVNIVTPPGRTNKISPPPFYHPNLSPSTTLVVPKFPLQYLPSNPTPTPQNFWVPLLGLFCTTSEKNSGGWGLGWMTRIQEGDSWKNVGVSGPNHLVTRAFAVHYYMRLHRDEWEVDRQ